MRKGIYATYLLANSRDIWQWPGLLFFLAPTRLESEIYRAPKEIYRAKRGPHWVLEQYIEFSIFEAPIVGWIRIDLLESGEILSEKIDLLLR